MRSLLIAAMVLWGCEAAETAPRIAVMPDLQMNLSARLNSDVRCVWNDADLRLFNQPDQHLLFRYQQCPIVTADGFAVDDGNIIVMTERIESTHKSLEMEVMRVHKLGPLTAEAFIVSQMSAAGQNDPACKAVKLAPNVWTAQHASTVLIQGNSMEMATNLDEVWARDHPCGRVTSYQDLTLTFFGIDQGIAFEIRAPGVGSTIDLASLKYENRG